MKPISVVPVDLGADDDGARRRRLQVVVALVLGAACILTARLAFIQVVESDHFRAMATDEHFRRTVVPPRRGNIFDSTGQLLASTIVYQSLYASTNEIDDPLSVAARLAGALKTTPDSLTTVLAHKQAAPTLLRRRLPQDVADSIRQLGLPGIFLQPEPGRAYPQGTQLEQVLGVVGVDNNGLSGIELQYDGDLAGKPGSLVAERDSGGDAIALGPRLYQAPTDGASLTLTIDRYVQWVAERELDSAIQAHHGISGTIVIVDPRNGSLLAIASRPTFHQDDPDLFGPRNVSLYPIPAVGAAIEPGPVFDIVTMAAAVETGSVTPQTSFLNTGSYEMTGRILHDRLSRATAPMSMLQALELSSDVGLSWAASKVGASKYYRLIDDFGLGQRTGVDLPGETAGQIRQPTEVDWDPFDLALNASGRGIAVTPIQLASAAATVANGGMRFQPIIVRRVEGPSGARALPVFAGRRVIRGETAATLTRMLVSAVDDPASEGRAARVPGYAMAGLSGTVRPVNESLAATVPTTDSFLGFGPAERPRFAMYVSIDTPSDTAGTDSTSASVFGTIARELMSYYQIPPSRPLAGNGT